MIGSFRRNACRVATAVAILLAITLVALPASARPVTWSQPRPAVQAPEYRAGSADSVFGPATAIGDFDADGRPDFAIADRVGGSAESDYRLEVRLSSGPPQIIRFASSQRRLMISAVDVDRDNDLDLVFTPVVGRRIVGVWVNDGSGHFERKMAATSLRDLDRAAVLAVPPLPESALPATVSHRVAAVRRPPAPAVIALASGPVPIRDLHDPSCVGLSLPGATRGPPSHC